MTSLPPHTLLQLSISLSSLLTLLCHIFLLSSSKPSACHTDPISSCMLRIIFLIQFSLCMLPILNPALSYYFTVYDLPIPDPEQHTSIRLHSHHLRRCYFIQKFLLFGSLIPISPNISVCAHQWPPHIIRVHL